MKQRLLTILLTLLPIMANADTVEIDGIYYNLITKGNIAEVTSNPSRYSGSISIPESVTYNDVDYSVTSIGERAFNNCSGLTSVTIPNSVTSFGVYAFSGCSGLTSVTIPNSVTSIGGGAFWECSGLTSVTIPNSVASISSGVFYNCSGLTSVTIPISVTSIDNGAFYGCYGLTSVHISDLEAWCNIKFVDNPLSYAHHLYLGEEEIKDLVIPNSVTSIGSSTFSGCSGLTSVTIHNNVTYIGGGAFSGCSGLTSVTIPNSVTSINNGVFYNCNGLTSVTIPNSVTSIGSLAFCGCSGLASVTIPNSVTFIDDYAFDHCSGLTSIIIGSGIKNIDNTAFASCTNLADVYCYAESVPTTKSNAFSDSYIEYATLHVPSSAVNAYKTADPWKNFKEIVAIDGSTPETKKCEKPTISYEKGQLKMSCATEGVEYVTDITNADIKKYNDATITLTATYNISVYATKSGYENSETATATLCWIDVEPKTEGITNGVANIRALPLLIQTNGSTLTISGADDGTPITVYSINGIEAGSVISQNGAAIIPTSLQPGSAAIVKVGKKAIKVVVK